LVDGRGMRILFLDDSLKRAKEFISNMVGTVVVHASTPNEAIKEIMVAHDPERTGVEGARSPFDAVFLDYDMDEEHAGKKGDGMDVVDWITTGFERADNLREALFVIHSLNKQGSRLMHDALKCWGMSVIVEPFAWQTMTPERLQELWTQYLKKEATS
jgi:CheY-like chemotaxis protein